MNENRPGRAHLKIIISTAAIIAAMVLTVQYISLARQNQELKNDLAEIDYIRYDLLNVDEWTNQLSAILAIKILEFKLTPESREKVVRNLENILYEMINSVEMMMKVKSSGNSSGIKSLFSGFTINLDPLRDSVPSYTNQLLAEISKPVNKAFLRQFLTAKLHDLAASTYNLDQQEPLQEVMKRYNCFQKEECQELIREKVEVNNKAITIRVILVMFLISGIFLVNLVSRGKINLAQATLLIIASFCLLLGGITTPMIDLEATISHLRLMLMGEELLFQKNIIFFQSKSITDVVRILFEEGTIPMIFVGVLVFTFSIIFPSLKLISSLLYAYRVGNLRENRLIRFFAIKSGKWSMADVLVVAIFMAFVGFNGIIGSQLDHLSESAKPVEIFTTNGTQLLEGFYLFLLFCISSLILSEVVTRKT